MLLGCPATREDKQKKKKKKIAQFSSPRPAKKKKIKEQVNKDLPARQLLPITYRRHLPQVKGRHTPHTLHTPHTHHTPHFSQRPPPSQPKCLSYQYLHVFVVDLQIVLANLLLFCKLLTGIPGNGIQPTSPLSPGKHPPTHTHAPHAQIHRYTSVVNTCVQ